MGMQSLSAQRATRELLSFVSYDLHICIDLPVDQLLETIDERF